MWRRLKLFYSLPFKLKLLYVEAFLFLGWARLLLYVPFSRIVALIGTKVSAAPDEVLAKHVETSRNIGEVVARMGGCTLWESRCLVQAIAGLKMLERRGIRSTLYLGTRKEAADGLTAHAWLSCGRHIIVGEAGHERYTVVGIFLSRGSS